MIKKGEWRNIKEIPLTPILNEGLVFVDQWPHFQLIARGDHYNEKDFNTLSIRDFKVDLDKYIINCY